MREQASRARRYIADHLVESLLTGFLTLLLALSSFGIRGHLVLSQRVSDNALQNAKTAERYEALCNEVDLKNDQVVASVGSLEKSSSEMEKSIVERIRDLTKRLDQRCDTLESLIRSHSGANNRGD